MKFLVLTLLVFGCTASSVLQPPQVKVDDDWIVFQTYRKTDDRWLPDESVEGYELNYSNKWDTFLGIWEFTRLTWRRVPCDECIIRVRAVAGENTSPWTKIFYKHPRRSTQNGQDK